MPTTSEAPTLVEAFQQTVERCADKPALRARDGGTQLTWREYGDAVRELAGGFFGLGVRHGDPVALMLANRPEFHLVDGALLHLGAIPFSIYNTSSAEQVRHLLADSAARLVVTERALVGTVRAAGHDTAATVVIDDGGLDDVRAAARDDFDVTRARRSVDGEDVATIIYTSGTTGPPKGVELTHAAVLACIRGYEQVVDFPDEGRVISWLPLAHIAERCCSHYLPMARGYSATCCLDPREVVAALPEVRPTWFFAVPRVWEKLKAAIEAQLPEAARPALELGLRHTRASQEHGQAPDELHERWLEADAAVFAALRRRLGLDAARSVNVGAAPSSPEVIEFFHAIGIPLAELWGMSESCASGCVNPPERIKIGTVGPPLPGFHVRLAEDGEILLKGPALMKGYRNAPEQTAEAIDQEGWLHTGDIGEIDDDGYVRIVDRKKEVIVNASGKNMSPANIESAIKAADPIIEHVVAIGDRRPYTVALIVLDADGPAPDEVGDRIERAVAQANERLSRAEQIKRFTVLGEPWRPGGDELTPTGKLKRKPIADKYARDIDALYARSSAPADSLP